MIWVCTVWLYLYNPIFRIFTVLHILLKTVREPGDGKKKNKASGEGEGPGSGDAGPPAKKKFESSQDSSNKGGGQKQGSPRGPASNVMKERMARIRFVHVSHLIYSSPGQSPGRAIALPPALALASAVALAKC